MNKHKGMSKTPPYAGQMPVTNICAWDFRSDPALTKELLRRQREQGRR